MVKMGGNILDKVLESVIFIALVVAVAPLLTTYLAYLGTNMSGFGLAAIYASGGILYLLFGYFVLKHIWNMWKP